LGVTNEGISELVGDRALMIVVMIIDISVTTQVYPCFPDFRNPVLSGVGKKSRGGKNVAVTAYRVNKI
jgi:hypothetical protein